MNWLVKHGDPRAELPELPCECGHERDVHEHHRRGSDCALCGAEVCTKFSNSRATVSD